MITPREREVLLLHAKGLSHKEIAAALGITLSTVKNLAYELRQKLNARNLTQALIIVYGLMEVLKR